MNDQHPHKIIASLIELKPEYTLRYKALHRHPFPAVIERILTSTFF
jgi:L-rhamnose mutarotase